MSNHAIPDEKLLSTFQELRKTAEEQRVFVVGLLAIVIALARTPSLSVSLTEVSGIKTNSQPAGVSFFVAWGPLIAFAFLVRSYFSLKRAVEVGKILLKDRPGDDLLLRVILALMLVPTASVVRAGHAARQIEDAGTAWKIAQWIVAKCKRLSTLLIIELPYIAYLIYCFGDFFFLSRILPDRQRPIFYVLKLPCNLQRLFASEQLKSQFDDPSVVPFPGFGIALYMIFGIIIFVLLVCEWRRWLSFWGANALSQSQRSPE